MPAAAVLLLAAAVAAGSLDPARVALRHALDDDYSPGCPATEIRTAVRNADISVLGTLGGRKVVLASPQSECICGNVNCPYLVLRLDAGGASAVLLDTSAYGVEPAGHAQPLPDLREIAHNSALISNETIDVFRAGKYVAASTARVRSDNGARKPDGIPIHFAPGASSATVTGTVSQGWWDEYALGAAQDQHITIAGPAGLTYSLTSRVMARSIELKPGVPARIPAGGTYLLQIDGGSDAEQAYRATVTIR